MNVRSKIGSMTLHSAWCTTRSRNGAARDQPALRIVDVEASGTARAGSVCATSSSCSAEQLVLQVELERRHRRLAALALRRLAVGQPQVLEAGQLTVELIETSDHPCSPSRSSRSARIALFRAFVIRIPSPSLTLWGRGVAPSPDPIPQNASKPAFQQKPEIQKPEADRDTTTRKPRRRGSRQGRPCHGRRSGRTSDYRPTTRHAPRGNLPRPTPRVRPPDHKGTHNRAWNCSLPQRAPRPLPDIAGHVQQAEGAGAAREHPDRAGLVQAEPRLVFAIPSCHLLPHGHRNPFGPRAAFSHSASEGRRTTIAAWLKRRSAVILPRRHTLRVWPWPRHCRSEPASSRPAPRTRRCPPPAASPRPNADRPTSSGPRGDHARPARSHSAYCLLRSASSMPDRSASAPCRQAHPSAVHSSRPVPAIGDEQARYCALVTGYRPM